LTAAAGVASRREGKARASFALALMLALAFSFTGLSNHPLRAADETRGAGIAWEMAHTGNALLPHLGGDPFMQHPPRSATRRWSTSG
jgi:4-amino-4-deoxy-L-arabinose transferase-like glycosyltransferase